MEIERGFCNSWAFNVLFWSPVKRQAAIPVFFFLLFLWWVGTAKSTSTSTTTTPTRTTSGRRKVDYKRSRSISVWASIPFMPTWQTLNTKSASYFSFSLALFMANQKSKYFSLFYDFLKRCPCLRYFDIFRNYVTEKPSNMQIAANPLFELLYCYIL